MIRCIQLTSDFKLEILESLNHSRVANRCSDNDQVTSGTQKLKWEKELIEKKSKRVTDITERRFG